MAARDIVAASGPRKLLAIDGGGIRGVLSVEVLMEIEKVARRAYGKSDLVLSDCFDYFAGTSTGAIIATALAIGMPVDEIRSLYEESGPLMFSPARIRDRLRFQYDDEPLAAILKRRLGAETTLGSDNVRTLLLLMLRDATTDSPWPVSNNPAARFNDPSVPSCNLRFPLWQLVRASTAAPLFFPPEQITVDGHDHVFVDGSLTPYANPAFQLFLMATVDAYRLSWPCGEDEMLLVSVGTGMPSRAEPDLVPEHMTLLYHATSVPQAMLAATIVQQDMLCRVFGRCKAGYPIDAEIDDLARGRGPVEPKLFTYLRYDIEMSREILDSFGLHHVRDLERLRHPNAVHAIADLQAIGKALASTVVPEHFAGFFPDCTRVASTCIP